jgi:thioredoxin-dependent peroxiredoxin
MRTFVSGRVAVAALALALAAPHAQLFAQAAPAETGPKVGDMAPDFTLGGATRFGVLRDQIKLSDYKGNTVVLAFFFKARTKG